jgi:hypothetical protein
MAIILVLAGAAFVGGLVWLARAIWPPRRLAETLPLAALAGQGGFTRFLAVPLAAWTLLFLLLLVVLLFVSGICLMYTFALLHGEFFRLLEVLPQTAGNAIVHLIYPLQMFLFALMTFVLAVGGMQLVFGPLQPLEKFAWKVDGVADLARKLAALIAVTAGLEIVKIFAYGLLVRPDELDRFFARDALPKADPLGAALLAGAMLLAVAAWFRRRSADP